MYHKSFRTYDAMHILYKKGDKKKIIQSINGMKMYVSKDRSGGNGDEIFEYDLACPFNVVSGKCELTKDRTALAESKIELAKRTIDYSTKSVINRLKWVRRHKEKQNLFLYLLFVQILFYQS